MRFDSSAALANHVKKFCSDSSYGNVQKLEERLQQLGHKPVIQNPNLRFQDVRNFLKGEGPVDAEAQQTIAKMNLDDLKNYFQSENQNYEELQKQATRAKERELIDEIEEFKREKNEIRIARLQQDRALAELSKELELKREKDARARIEKADIQKALKELERTKVTAMEKEKKRELEKLAEERENLRLREEEVLEEIRSLEARVEEQERQMREEKDMAGQRLKDLEGQGMMGRRREIELAKERGEYIAYLQLKRDQLERDRVRIMDDLDKIKNGDFQAFRANEASRWVANDILFKAPNSMNIDINRIKLDPALKDKLLSDEVRIRQLKEARQNTLREAMPESTELDPFMRSMQDYPTEQKQQFFNTSRGVPNNQPAGPRTMPSPFKQDQPKASKSQRVTFGDDESAMIDKLAQLRQDYALSCESDPTFNAYLEDLERHLLNKEPVFKTKASPMAPPQKYQPEPQSQYQNPFQIKPPLPMQQPSFTAQPQNTFQPQTYQQGFMPPPIIPDMQQMLGTMPQFSLPIPQLPLQIMQQPVYMPPPPQMYPQMKESAMDKLLSQLNQEPQPVQVQSYIPPQRNEEIEQVNYLIQEQEQQNQMLERELNNLSKGLITIEEFEKLLSDRSMGEIELTKRKLLGGQVIKKKNLPDDFKFRQNDYRAEDMEVEERALMNIAAQEFDQLRILSKIPKNTDLYRHKMEQYKEMSAMRVEMEKVLQEQKLEKIRRDFERQKHEDQRQFQHNQWLDEQQKALLQTKLQMAQNQPAIEVEQEEEVPAFDYNQGYGQMPSPVYQPPPGVNQHVQVTDRLGQELDRQDSFREDEEEEFPLPEIKSEIRPPEQIKRTAVPSERNNDPDMYNPQVGFNIYFDLICRIQRQYRSMRLVYAVYNVSRPLVPPSLIDIHDAEPDPEDPNEKNRIIFQEYSSIRNVQPHPSSNLIIELQIPKPNTGSHDKFVSFGWTVLNLFDSQYQFNRGVFKLPIYTSPTKTDVDIRDMHTYQRIPETLLLFRIGNPDDLNTRFIMNALTTPDDYSTPRIHQFSQGQQEMPGNINQLELPQDNESIQFNPQYECRGIRAYVHFVKYYVPPSNSKIQLTLYEGTNIVRSDDGRMCNWASRQFDSQNLLFSQPTNPMNQGLGITQTEISRGEIITVEDEISWNKDLYQIQFGPQGTKQNSDVNIVVQVMESKVARGTIPDPRSEYQALAYGVLRINNSDGTIRYGTHDVPLFRPPVNLVRRNPADMVKQIIKITIGQPMGPPQQMNRTPNVQNRQPQTPMQQQQNKSPAPAQTPNRQPQPPPQPKEKPFIPNEIKQYFENPFKEGEGIDLYIDGARFLPENVTFSRIIMRAFTVDQIRVIDPMKGSCRVEISSARNPFYGFRFEIRAAKLDPTIIVMATIETFDRSDGLPKVVGHAYFPLFLNQSSKRQHTDRNSNTIMLQNGSYQVPVYLDRLPPEKQLTLENMGQLEKIPCATLLLRVFKAPMDGNRVLGLRDVNMQDWKTKGVIVDPPDYLDGSYNTQYCMPSPFETALYDYKGVRYSPPMNVVTNYLKRVKGKNIVMTDDDVINWLDSSLVTQASTPSINMRYFSAYVAKFGFRYSVERLHGLTQKLPHIVTSSIAPPCALYGAQPRKTADVSIFQNYNQQSHWSSVQFNEEYINYTGLQMSIKLGFILDVKAMSPGSNGTQELIDVGWTFLAIYSVLENEDGSQSLYCNSGLHALPLFPGPPPKDILAFIQTNQQNIMSLLKMDRNNKTLEFSSVIVRIHDNQRERIPARGNYSDIISTNLPQEKLNQYIFTPESKWTDASGADAVKSVVPSQIQSNDAFKQAVTTAFNLKYNVA